MDFDVLYGSRQVGQICWAERGMEVQEWISKGMIMCKHSVVKRLGFFFVLLLLLFGCSQPSYPSPQILSIQNSDDGQLALSAVAITQAPNDGCELTIELKWLTDTPNWDLHIFESVGVECLDSHKHPIQNVVSTMVPLSKEFRSAKVVTYQTECHFSLPLKTSYVHLTLGESPISCMARIR